MTWLLLPLTLALVAYCAIIIRRTALLTAETIFVYLQFVMAAGSLPLLDPGLPSDRVYAAIIAYTTLAFMVTSALLCLSKPEPDGPLTSMAPSTYRPNAAFWILFTIALTITIAYYSAVGYSAFIQGLLAGATGDGSDIAGLRLDSYSGSRYLFPGYVNQFKNALLPSLVVLAITAWALERKRKPATTAALCAVAVLGLIGTGQRGAFVIFIGIVVVFLLLINKGRIPRRLLLLGGVLFLSVIIVTTFALGRVALQDSASVSEHAVSALNQFSLRISAANQSSGVIGFRYIYELGPLYDGSEWVKSLSGILPGQRGSTLQNEIFALRYGSDRGTSPPSIWGSVYYNFGPIGVVLAPVVLAALYRRVVAVALSVRDRNTLELIGISGIFVVLGFWVSDTPLFLLNRALAAYAFLWLWGSSVRRRTTATQRHRVRAVS